MSEGPQRPADDVGPSTPVATGEDRVVRAIHARLREDEDAERDAQRGSRVARGCSAVVAGTAALLFGMMAVVTVLAAVQKGGGAGGIFAGVVLSVFASGFGFLAQRWIRGLPPVPAAALPPPEHARRDDAQG